MSKWRSVPLGDLVDPERGISYGIVQPGRNVENGVPIVRVADLKGDRIQVAQPLRVSPEIAAKHRRTLLQGGELIVSIVGSIGQTAIIDEQHVGWNVARAVAVLPVLPKPGAYWVRLSMRGGPAKTHIDGRLNTTVQATLNLRDLAELPIPMPADDIRKDIEELIGALDDKIELNRRMNETLEEMARAVFRDWFVEFGPVRAKMEGRPPYLAPILWSLFPDKLGNDGIPLGWEQQSIYEFADVIYGAPFSSKQFNSEKVGTPLIRIRDLTSQTPSVFTQEQHRKGHLIEAGDIVVGMDGEFRPHIWRGENSWLNQRVCHFEPKSPVSVTFLLEALRPSLDFFERGKVGTTVIHLGKKDIDTFKVIGPIGVVHRFC